MIEDKRKKKHAGRKCRYVLAGILILVLWLVGRDKD
jgi:hypothetical protein